MKRPWFPFWPRDYLADTQHLSTAEHGAYCLLILHYWQQGGLPDVDAELAKITRLPVVAWRRMRPTIQAFFHDGWQHKRIDQDIAKLDTVVAKRSAAGSIGGTRASINRRIGQQLLHRNSSNTSSNTSSKTAAIVQQTGQQNSSNRVATKEDILTPVSGTARARPGTPENFPANSTETNGGSQPQAPDSPSAKGLGEQARRGV